MRLPWSGFVPGLLVAVLGCSASQPVAMDVRTPELVGNQWVNTPGGEPVRLADRRGKVTVVQFWTFGCVNCRRNLPSYDRWYRQFGGQDVVVIGIHTPETEAERNPANVRREVKQLGIEYPVLLDPEGVNWRRWQQQYWPTVYLIDKKGRVRYRWEGELEYGNAGGEAKLARLIQALLEESDGL